MAGPYAVCGKLLSIDDMARLAVLAIVHGEENEFDLALMHTFFQDIRDNRAVSTAVSVMLDWTNDTKITPIMSAAMERAVSNRAVEPVMTWVWMVMMTWLNGEVESAIRSGDRGEWLLEFRSKLGPMVSIAPPALGRVQWNNGGISA